MKTRVLLVGINEYPDMPLAQCVVDIERSLRGVQERFGVRNRDIRILTDGEARAGNYRERLDWLTHGLAAGDRILWHYSGHGTYVEGAEADGFDEAICPVDWDWNNRETWILDDEIHGYLMRISEGVSATVIADCCYSGGASRAARGRRRWMIPPAGMRRRGVVRRIGGRSDVQCAWLAACGENETAAETEDGGALTTALWRVLYAHSGWALGRVAQTLRRRVNGQTVGLSGPEAICRRAFMESIR